MANSKKLTLSKPQPNKKPGLPKKTRGLTDQPAGHAADQLKTHLEATLSSTVHAGQTLLLAFSGGLDSRVLLQLLAELRPHSGFNLRAMHVHHGLSPNADEWADFCRAACAKLAVPLQIVRVSIPRDSGLGLEATARVARYRALLDDAADYVLLAHHQDDQSDTVLLQLLRGAGLKGLSAMAAVDEERRLLRPLLHISRAELEAYAKQQGLQWIEDESNADIAYDRNYCRHQIFPVLLMRFPTAKLTLARSATHMAEAAQLLDELAALDAKAHLRDQQLDLTGLASMPEPRARNLLRWWLSANQQSLPSTSRLQEALRQLLSAKPDATIKVALGNGLLRRYQGFAYLEPNVPSQPISMVWQGEADLCLPDNSHLIFARQMGCGLAFERLGIHKLRISHRLGGERFKPDLMRPTRTLKHLLQEAHMPPWLRERLPLIYSEDTLAVVPGIGVACELQAKQGEPGLVIAWQQS